MAWTSYPDTFQRSKTAGMRLLNREDRSKGMRKEGRDQLKIKRKNYAKRKEDKSTLLRRTWRPNTTGWCCCWSAAMNGLQVGCSRNVEIRVFVWVWVLTHTSSWISEVVTCIHLPLFVSIVTVSMKLLFCFNSCWLASSGPGHVATCPCRNAGGKIHAKPVNSADCA